MIGLVDAEVRTRGKSRFETRAVSLEGLEEAIGQMRIDPLTDLALATNTTTAATSVSLAGEDIAARCSGWVGIDLDWLLAEPASPTTRATTPTATTVSSVRNLLRMRRKEERIKRMSPDRRALYERIVGRRERIGPMKFDVSKALRELRENG